MIYKINKNAKYVNINFFSRLNFHYNLKSVNYLAKFDTKCCWDHPVDDEDYLLNTLCGIQFGFNKKNAIKIVWRPDFTIKNTINLYGLSYNIEKNIEKITFITKVVVDEFFTIKINGFKDKFYSININGAILVIDKQLPTKKWGFFINPSMHKETTAIDDMLFYLKRIVRHL